MSKDAPKERYDTSTAVLLCRKGFVVKNSVRGGTRYRLDKWRLL